MIALYVFGIVMGIVMALIFKKTAFKGEAVPFVMELPNYRMPGAKNVDICYGIRQKTSCREHLRLYSLRRSSYGFCRTLIQAEHGIRFTT